MRLYTTLLLALAATFAVAGCTPVKPWQKGNLAKSHMRFDPDRLDARFMEHVYESREGSRGGRGASTGGCGCN